MPEFLRLQHYAFKHHLADVISQSWDTTEDTLFTKPGRALMARFHQVYRQAAAQGITELTASGDLGASGPDSTGTGVVPGNVVQFPDDDPLVLSVGATTLSIANTAGSPARESACPCGGGGASKIYAEPAYQRTLPHATQTLLHGRRGVPDVAFDGDPATPVLYVLAGAWGTANGTSLGTPAWAGVLALADQAAGRDLGAVNSALYRIAASKRYASDFHDIVRGSNYTFSQPAANAWNEPAYKAGIGWDAATGLGTPRVSNLVVDLANTR
jgi:subtilase family serine protease